MELCVILNPGARGYFPSHLKLRGSQEGVLLLGNGGLGSGERALEQLSNQGTITCGRSDLKSHISCHLRGGERDGLYMPRASELTVGKRKPSIVLAAGLLAWQREESLGRRSTSGCLALLADPQETSWGWTFQSTLTDEIYQSHPPEDVAQTVSDCSDNPTQRNGWHSLAQGHSLTGGQAHL